MRRVSANKNVLSIRLNSVRQMSCCRSSAGRLFHSRGPATPKLLSPSLDCVRGTFEPPTRVSTGKIVVVFAETTGGGRGGLTGCFGRIASAFITCFQIQRDTGLWYSVEYSSFSLGPEADKYRLSVSGFSGDEGDAIAAAFLPQTRSNGMQFSCLGEDNDNKSNGLCMTGNSGWWFNWCSRSMINMDGNSLWNAATEARTYDVISSRMLVKLG